MDTRFQADNLHIKTQMLLVALGSSGSPDGGGWAAAHPCP